MHGQREELGVTLVIRLCLPVTSSKRLLAKTACTTKSQTIKWDSFCNLQFRWDSRIATEIQLGVPVVLNADGRCKAVFIVFATAGKEWQQNEEASEPIELAISASEGVHFCQQVAFGVTLDSHVHCGPERELILQVITALRIVGSNIKVLASVADQAKTLIIVGSAETTVWTSSTKSTSKNSGQHF